MENIVYAVLSSLIVSIIPLIGIIFFVFNRSKIQKYLYILVSFSIGSLLGGAFFHLVPESLELNDDINNSTIFMLLGMLIFFLFEKYFHSKHKHCPNCNSSRHIGYLSLFTDGIHNFVDGLLIGIAYSVDIELGIATTIAVAAHEVPQEIGDFGILLHSGFSLKKAISYNLISASTALFGTIIAIISEKAIFGLKQFFIPFAAGGFIYLSLSVLVPEIQKINQRTKNIIQIVTIILSLLIFYSLAGHHHHHHHD